MINYEKVYSMYNLILNDKSEVLIEDIMDWEVHQYWEQWKFWCDHERILLKRLIDGHIETKDISLEDLNKEGFQNNSFFMYFNHAIDQEWEGWSSAEIVTIELLLMDIKRAYKATHCNGD